MHINDEMSNMNKCATYVYIYICIHLCMVFHSPKYKHYIHIYIYNDWSSFLITTRSYPYKTFGSESFPPRWTFAQMIWRCRAMHRGSAKTCQEWLWPSFGTVSGLGGRFKMYQFIGKSLVGQCIGTLLGTNISPTVWHFWVDDFPFPVWWKVFFFETSKMDLWRLNVTNFVRPYTNLEPYLHDSIACGKFEEVMKRFGSPISG